MRFIVFHGLFDEAYDQLSKIFRLFYISIFNFRFLILIILAEMTTLILQNASIYEIKDHPLLFIGLDSIPSFTTCNGN